MKIPITIEEIALNEKEIAEDYQRTIDTHMVSENVSLEEMYCDDTEVIEKALKRHKKLLDYHNTIADTMHKYQKIEQIIKDHDAGIILEEYDYWYIDKIRKVIEDRNDD